MSKNQQNAITAPARKERDSEVLYWKARHSEAQQETARLKLENARLLMLAEANLRAISNSPDQPEQIFIFETKQGDPIGVYIDGLGAFTHPTYAARFAELTNELTGLTAEILLVATYAVGTHRREHIRKQQYELMACYGRFRTLLESAGEDPDSVPTYVSVKRFVNEIESGLKDALETDSYTHLKQIARSAPRLFGPVLRELENMPQRQRAARQDIAWIAENMIQIRGEFLRREGYDQPYEATARELLDRLETITATWASDASYNISRFLEGKFPDLDGLRRYLQNIENRAKGKKRGAIIR